MMNLVQKYLSVLVGTLVVVGDIMLQVEVAVFGWKSGGSCRNVGVGDNIVVGNRSRANVDNYDMLAIAVMNVGNYKDVGSFGRNISD